MTSMSNEATQAAALKPCPFCGKEAEFSMPHLQLGTVNCTYCSASTPSARRWNTRAIEAAAPIIRAEERAGIVEWLRSMRAWEYADAIERGDHRKP